MDWIHTTILAFNYDTNHRGCLISAMKSKWTSLIHDPRSWTYLDRISFPIRLLICSDVWRRTLTLCLHRSDKISFRSDTIAYTLSDWSGKSRDRHDYMRSCFLTNQRANLRSYTIVWRHTLSCRTACVHRTLWCVTSEPWSTCQPIFSCLWNSYRHQYIEGQF